MTECQATLGRGVGQSAAHCSQTGAYPGDVAGWKAIAVATNVLTFHDN